MSSLTFCWRCDRGGNGNAKDKCACGWTVTDQASPQGCYLGTPIIGAIKPKPKISRAKKRYRDYLESDSSLSFGEWLKSRAEFERKLKEAER